MNSTKYINKFLENLSSYIFLLNKLNYLIKNLKNFQNIKTITELNIKKMDKDINTYIENINKLFDFKNEITIIYKIARFFENHKIKIFEDSFVEKNKDKCSLFINNKKNQLCSYYDLSSKSNLLNIKLVENSPINDISNMIRHDDHLFYLSNNEWVKESNKNKFKDSEIIIWHSDFIKFEGDYDYSFNFAIVGAEEVGKSSLLIKLGDGIYKNYHYYPDVDFRVIKFKINKVKRIKNCKLMIWDFPGSDYFSALTKGYLKRAEVFILLYDIANKGSFEKIDKYFNVIKREKLCPIIFLMGNKNDLSFKRCVEIEEAKEKCRKLNIIWGGECSAKSNSKKELIDIFKKLTYKLV